MKSFLSRFGHLISFVLSGFDRLRFRGDATLLSNQRGVDAYLYGQNVRYVDFPKHCQQLTDTLCRRTEALAKEHGVPLKHLNSPLIDKEATALQLAGSGSGGSATPAGSTPAGRIALLTCVESCSTYRLRKNAEGRVYPIKEMGKCLHYYHYFQHPELGLCYARIQSYFPFTVRVGMNGRQWLYRQLQNRNVDFQSKGNLLISLNDTAHAALAQQLLDEQVDADYVKILSELVDPIQPLSQHLRDTRVPYYWLGEQTEWANDFVFKSPADLALWYPRWIRHGIENLSCTDVMRYLGKKQPKACAGEAKIDLRERVEGTRLKFWYKTNSIKIYDKEGIALRPETTINQPSEFTVYRKTANATKEDQPAWRPMRKGVADMARRAEVSQSANNHLLESLATVADTQTLGELLKPLGRPVIKDGKRLARPLNPLTGKDGDMLRHLANGDFLIKGFRNADVRTALYGTKAETPERRSQSAAVTRLLTLFRAHGLITKIAKTHRYQLSAAGRRTATALLAAYGCDANKLMAG